MDKNFQNQLREHKIKPSAKPWERIEAELNRQKKPATFVIYSRWAAAASVALMVTAYANWNHTPLNASVAEATQSQKTIESNIAQNNEENISPKTIVVPNTVAEIPIIKYDFRLSPKKNNPIQSIDNQNITNNIKIENVIENKVATITTQRNKEVAIAQLNSNLKALLLEQKEIKYSDLPEFSNILTAEANKEFRWRKVLSEDFSEESDSTFTERALVIANKKTVAFFSNNWKPALKEWFRLRKGF